MATISAVVNSFNAEQLIVDCLESLRWADDVMVVDAQSSDGTVDVARRFTDRVFDFPFTGHVEPARNFAIGKATGDWVLVMDQDERVPPRLAQRLRELADGGTECSAVLIPRKNHFCGQWIDSPHSYPDYQTRFFRRGSVVWPETIHSRPQVSGSVLTLEPDPELALVHLANESLSSAIRRLDLYTTVEARQLHERGVPFDWWQMLVEPARETLRRYFQWGMYRHGVYGVVAALIGCFHGAMVYAKLWEFRGYGGADAAEFQQLRGRKQATWFLLRRLLKPGGKGPPTHTGDRVGL